MYVGDNMAKPRNEWNQTTKTKQNEWRKKNRALLGADLPKQEGDSFRAICKKENVSVSAALSVFVRACIDCNSLDVIRDDDGTTAAGSIQDNDGRRDDIPDPKNSDPAFQQGDQANENDTPGTVDSRPGFDTPGTVD